MLKRIAVITVLLCTWIYIYIIHIARCFGNCKRSKTHFHSVNLSLRLSSGVPNTAEHVEETFASSESTAMWMEIVWVPNDGKLSGKSGALNLHCGKKLCRWILVGLMLSESLRGVMREFDCKAISANANIHCEITCQRIGGTFWRYELWGGWCSQSTEKTAERN